MTQKISDLFVRRQPKKDKVVKLIVVRCKPENFELYGIPLNQPPTIFINKKNSKI